MKLGILPNGLRVAVLPMPHARSVAVELRIRGVGPAHETPEQNGIGHLLEHCLGRGTLTRPGAAAIAAAWDDLGAEIDLATDCEGMALSVRTTPDRLGPVLALLAEVVREPALLPGDVLAEIGLVLDESESEGDWVDGQLVDADTRMRAELFGDPLGQPIVGSPQSVRTCGTAEALRAHHARCVVAANMVLTVSGNIDPEATLVTIAKAFSSIPSGSRASSPPLVLTTGPTVAWIADGEERASVSIGFAIERSAPRARAAAEMLLQVLDGGEASLLPLMRSAVARAYDLHASVEWFEQCGMLTISTSSRQPTRSIVEILELLKTLVACGVSQPALDRARRLVQLLHADVDVAEVATFAADAMIANDSAVTVDAQTARLLSVTADQITRVARTIFMPENLAVIVSGDLLAMDRLEIEREIEAWRPPTVTWEAEVQALIPQWERPRAAAGGGQ